MRITPAVRISLGLVSLTISLLLLALHQKRRSLHCKAGAAADLQNCNNGE